MSLGPAFVQLASRAGTINLDLSGKRETSDRLWARDDIHTARAVQDDLANLVSKYLESLGALSKRNKIKAGTPEAEAVVAANAAGANLQGAPLRTTSSPAPVTVPPVDLAPEDDVTGTVSSSSAFNINSYLNDFNKRTLAEILKRVVDELD